MEDDADDGEEAARDGDEHLALEPRRCTKLSATAHGRPRRWRPPALACPRGSPARTPARPGPPAAAPAPATPTRAPSRSSATGLPPWRVPIRHAPPIAANSLVNADEVSSSHAVIPAEEAREAGSCRNVFVWRVRILFNFQGVDGGVFASAYSCRQLNIFGDYFLINCFKY